MYFLPIKSRIHVAYLRDYEKCIENNNKLPKMFRELGDLEGEAFAYRWKFIDDAQFDKYSQCLESAYRAFEIYNKLGNKKGIAISTERLSFIYFFLKDYEKSKYSEQLTL